MNAISARVHLRARSASRPGRGSSSTRGRSASRRRGRRASRRRRPRRGSRSASTGSPCGDDRHRELVVVRLRPVPLRLDRRPSRRRAASDSSCSIVSRDPRRVDPVGDLGEEPELEAVAGLAGAGSAPSGTRSPAVVLGEPGRLEVVLAEHDQRVAARPSPQSRSVSEPAVPVVVRPGDLLDDASSPAGDATISPVEIAFTTRSVPRLRGTSVSSLGA